MYMYMSVYECNVYTCECTVTLIKIKELLFFQIE